MHLPGSVHNIVLVGFMGSGKSSVGREIAGRCELRFLDTDSIIRHNYRKSIADIFASFGEPVFRDEENRVLQDLQNAGDVVLATGGGIVLQSRPLLQTADPRATIRNLMSARYPLYRSVADITLETSGLTHQEVEDRLIAAIGVWSAGRNED